MNIVHRLINYRSNYTFDDGFIMATRRERFFYIEGVLPWRRCTQATSPAGRKEPQHTFPAVAAGSLGPSVRRCW